MAILEDELFFNAKRKVETLALKLYSSYVIFGEVKGGPLVWSWLNTTPFKLYIITVNTLPLLNNNKEESDSLKSVEKNTSGFSTTSYAIKTHRYFHDCSSVSSMSH